MEAIAERAERQSTALPSEWIDRLFARFAAAYGTEKFSSLWRTQKIADVKALWAAELGKFSRDELARAVDALRVKHPSWPPTLFEFVDLCRPTSIDPETAFHEAVRGTYARRDGKPGEWSQRAIFWAAQDVSPFDVLNCAWPQIRSRWTKALEARLADPNLPAIPEVPKRLPEPERVRTGDNPAFDKLAANVGSEAKNDNRHWARKIFERKAAGDRTLTHYAYRMACEALPDEVPST